jgi:sugar O-acyltransferase (sialic acid O-acetyltransferase NeuD family)
VNGAGRTGGRPAGTDPGGDLVIVGAGGFARETAQAVREAAAAGVPWRLLGHLDDDPALHGREVDGVPVLGGSALVRELSGARVLLCTGSPRDPASRARLARRLALPPERYATVVHPAAAVSASSVAGPGSVLLAHCVLTAAVRVGAHVAVMPHTVLTHDDVVEDFATLASGVRLGGGARVATGAYVGAGALVREYVTVGAWSLVGTGSVVLRDVPRGEVWAGAPARRLRPTAPAAPAELSAPRPDPHPAPAEHAGAPAVPCGPSAGHDAPAPARRTGAGPTPVPPQLQLHPHPPAAGRDDTPGSGRERQITTRTGARPDERRERPAT